jgi:transcription antitermination factor NusG
MEPLAPRHWYVVHTRSRTEKAVEADMVRRGVETFLPTVRRWRRWKDRRKEVEFPLFPGYCFVRICPSERLQVLGCPHVVGILTFNGHPVRVDVDEIENIRLLVRTQVPCETGRMIKAGDRVMVTRGPLKGLVGHLVRRGRSSRLELSVEAIARAVSVEVDAGDVEKC